MMVVRKYVQKDHDVGSHRHAPYTNSEELYRVKDQRSCVYTESESAYSVTIRARREGRRRTRGTLAGLALLLKTLATLAIASPLLFEYEARYGFGVLYPNRIPCNFAKSMFFT